jgi:lipoate-protein ligase A
MQRLDLTLPTAAENLALDEALLLEAEDAGQPREVLRLWEADAPLVVLGRSTPLGEINTTACAQRGIPVLRRSSGGAAIVTGPGCLMYAVVASYQRQPALRSIDATHAWVLNALSSRLQAIGLPTARQGTSDLTLGDRKFSGNALRCKREHVLYHGTLLYDFPLELIEACLGMPGRQPDYRDSRPHSEFVMNLPLAEQALRGAVIEAFTATDELATWPRERVQQLVADKYGRREWNVNAAPGT